VWFPENGHFITFNNSPGSSIQNSNNVTTMHENTPKKCSEPLLAACQKLGSYTSRLFNEENQMALSDQQVVCARNRMTKTSTNDSSWVQQRLRLPAIVVEMYTTTCNRLDPSKFDC